MKRTNSHNTPSFVHTSPTWKHQQVSRLTNAYYMLLYVVICYYNMQLCAPSIPYLVSHLCQQNLLQSCQQHYTYNKIDSHFLDMLRPYCFCPYNVHTKIVSSENAHSPPDCSSVAPQIELVRFDIPPVCVCLL